MSLFPIWVFILMTELQQSRMFLLYRMISPISLGESILKSKSVLAFGEVPILKLYSDAFDPPHTLLNLNSSFKERRQNLTVPTPDFSLPVYTSFSPTLSELPSSNQNCSTSPQKSQYTWQRPLYLLLGGSGSSEKKNWNQSKLIQPQINSPEMPSIVKWF